jgi:iron complex outermembrane recepter protein
MSSTLRVLLFCLLPLSFGQSVLAGGIGTVSADSATIEGLVVDAVSGQPLVGALIRVLGLGRQDVSHEGGEFHLVNLPAGRHTVLFERLGYRRETRVVVVARGESVSLHVEMRPSAIELPGIVVTGTTRASLGDETVRPANVLSGQELARKVDVTVAGTLQHEPGMAVTSMGPATGRPVIRGLGGDRVLVLEDGVRVGDMSATSADHALSVDPLNAQRIEVVRGPMALLYGSNAIGGVINVIRDEVPVTLPERATGIASLQGQSVNDGVAGGGSAQIAVGNMAVRGEASYRTAGDLRTPAGTLDNTDLRTYSLSAGASYVGGRGHAGAAYRYYDNAYGIPGGFVGSHPDGVRIEMRRHTLHGSAERRRRFGPFTSLDVDARYTNYHHRELEATDIIGTEFGLLMATGEVVARHDAWGPFSTGAVGTRFSWQDLQSSGTDTPPARELSGAAFILEEREFGRTRLQGGLRLDWHQTRPRPAADLPQQPARTFGSVSASLGGVHMLTRHVGFGASVSRAYRTPDMGELYSLGPHLAAYSFEVGNPELDAEIGHGVDVFVRLRGEGFTGEIAGFRNALANYIYYRDTGTIEERTGLPIYRATGADAVLTGAEATASAELVRHFVVNGTLSWVRGTLTTDRQPLPMVPPLRGNVTARYERPAYFAGLTWRGVAAQERVAVQEFETATPGHNVFDLDLGFRWLAIGRVQSLTLRVDNITDELVFDHLSRIRERDTGRRAPGAGRSAGLIYRMLF